MPTNLPELSSWLLLPCFGLVALWPQLLRTLARLLVAYASGLEAGSAAFTAAFTATFNADPCAKTLNQLPLPTKGTSNA